MNKFFTKLEELEALLKNFNASIKMPKMSTPKPPSLPKAGVAPKMPGMGPSSKKDPIKVAEQLKNKELKPSIKPQMLKDEAGPTHYRIHVDGHPVTEAMPLSHLTAKHGPVKHIESAPGHRVMPVKAPKPVKIAKNGQWNID